MDTSNLPRDFKGIWIPVELLHCRDLSRMETMLLSEIDSLDRGEGCWARASRLGDILKCSVGYIKNMLTSLRERGYVKTIKRTREKRFLRTCFSRHLGSSTCDFRGNQLVTSEVTSSLPPSGEISEIKKRNPPYPPSKRGEEGFFESGELPKSKGAILSEIFHNFASTKFCLKGKSPVIIKRWAKHFDRLLQNVPRKELKETLLWFFDQWRDQFTPKARNGYQFCEKYFDIREARKRWLKRNGEYVEMNDGAPKVTIVKNADGSETIW